LALLPKEQAYQVEEQARVFEQLPMAEPPELKSPSRLFFFYSEAHAYLGPPAIYPTSKKPPT